MHPAAHPAGGPFNLRMAMMSDDNHIIAPAMIVLYHAVNARYQRTGGIDSAQAALPGLRFRLHRDTMSTENADFAPWYFREIGDEAGSPLLKLTDYMLIMHNLMQYINRHAMTLDGQINGFDGPDDPGAKTARGCQDDIDRLLHFNCGLAQVAPGRSETTSTQPYMLGTMSIGMFE